MLPCHSVGAHSAYPVAWIETLHPACRWAQRLCGLDAAPPTGGAAPALGAQEVLLRLAALARASPGAQPPGPA